MIAVLAVDEGPRACVEPLLSQPGFVLFHEEPFPGDARALLCGTSDSPRGREIEAAARRAARRAGLPVVALEDYPGNYAHVAGGEADCLVVESAAAAEGRTAPTWVCPAPRYDALRRQAARLRATYARRDRARRLVLWAGQPETEDALATLGRVVPGLEKLGIKLLLRAHPRDAGHAGGAYRRIPCEDVTALSLAQCFERMPELLLTQFSQVAAEAGFYGIPSMHVLFADAGGRTLREKKGYDLPPSCASGASFVLRDPGKAEETLALALDDLESRGKALQNFDAYYATGRETLGELLAHLYNQGITRA